MRHVLDTEGGRALVVELRKNVFRACVLRQPRESDAEGVANRAVVSCGTPFPAIIFLNLAIQVFEFPRNHYLRWNSFKWNCGFAAIEFFPLGVPSQVQAAPAAAALRVGY